MSIELLAFSDRGYALAESLAKLLEGNAVRCRNGITLQGWTEQHFPNAEALIYVGAVGIAVRAIAPYVHKKTTDPAVVAVDELGQYAIPLLSGHLGGANDLARNIAVKIGAVPVITTATDINGKFAVDDWARKLDCAVRRPWLIKKISGAVLKGEKIPYHSDFPEKGIAPDELEKAGENEPFFAVSVHPSPEAVLEVIPRIVSIGIGCRRDTPQENIELLFQKLMEEYDLREESIAGFYSIDVKKNEPGLLAFCEAHRHPLVTFSAQQLMDTPGEYSSSAFVKNTVGVDNVCERSAVRASGGTVLCPKTALNGVTMAIAIKTFNCDWSLT